MNYINRIVLGDSKEILKEIAANSIDLIATDPPYGYSFMGSDWDTFKIEHQTKSQVVTWLGAGMKSQSKTQKEMIEFFVPIWKESLRILKHGAFIFVMCAPRQDVLCKQITSLQEGGFETGFTSIYWSYSSGFPKAMNISLVIDKRECKRLLQEKLKREPTKKEFEEEWKNFRTIIGKRIDAYGDPNLSETKDDRNVWGKESTREIDLVSNEPISLQAKELNGSFGGFQPKPAVEIIIVAMKPLNEKTYVDQALQNKKGITWFDNCRIPYDKIPENTIRKNKNTETILNKGFEGEAKTIELDLNGRFPANLLVSDNVLNVKSKGALAPVKAGQKGFGGIIYGKYKSGGDDGNSFYSDKETSKSYSRYFDLDIWFEKQFEKLPENVRKVFPFLIIPKAAKSEKNKGLIGGTGSNTYNRKCLKCKKWERNQGIDKEKYTCTCENPEFEKPSGNLHPTVKPLKLFSYLITLGSRENDLILDPFLGSGTTILAAKMLKRKYIGIELNQEYLDIAQKRLAAVEEILL